MRSVRRGALARLVAGSVAGATAIAGITVGLAAPAQAAPVSVTTTLTDQAGNALDGYVSAYALQPDGTYLSSARQYVADGVVNLPVEPGTYKFFFGDEDRLFISEYYNDKATFELADAVAVAGPTALAPVALAPRPVISGQVVAAGRVVEDQRVEILDATDGSPVTSGSTRPDGTFVIGVEPGTYKVNFPANRYAGEYFNNKPTLETADVVTVGASGANLGQIALTRGADVTGRITAPSGAPLERARASLYSASSGFSFVSDVSDANGVYVIEGVPAGSYQVQFTDPVGEYLSEWFNDKPSRATSDVITVGVDGVVSGVDAALAPDPNSAVDPATVDVAGVVKDSSGAVVIGASVLAFDTPADSDRPEVIDRATTNRAGQYHLTDMGASSVSENEFKIQVLDPLAREEGQYHRLDRWYGDVQSYGAARTVTTPFGGADVTLPLTGGISGAVSSESGLSVAGVQVRFFDEKGNPVAAVGGATEDQAGAYATTTLVPGTYKVQFVEDYFNYGDVRAHAPEWYDDTVFSRAEVITVRSGQTVTGIDAALSESLRAVRRPEILGDPYLGGKVRAFPGVWSLSSGTTYSYEWLVDDVVVGTERTYKVRKADKGERITLRVTAGNLGLDGAATTRSQVIKKEPKVKVTVKGKTATVQVKAKKVKPTKFKGTVVVKKIVRVDEFDAPVYKKIGKARLSNGSASLTLKKLTRGKNKLVFFITLKGGTYGNAEVAKTVKLTG